MSRPMAALLSLMLGVGLLLAGCSSNATPADAAGPDPQQISPSSQLSQRWPTSGLPAEGADGATLSRPVLVVKVDNTPSSAPQVGLDEADLVVEELVEGGVTRLAGEVHRVVLPGRSAPLDRLARPVRGRARAGVQDRPDLQTTSSSTRSVSSTMWSTVKRSR